MVVRAITLVCLALGLTMVGVVVTTFAQSTTTSPTTIDPVSGNSGWAGAGLLGGVLGWLLFIHLPAKDKQITALVSAKDEVVKEIIQSKDEAINAAILQFKIELQKERETCEKTFERIASSIDALVKSKGRS